MRKLSFLQSGQNIFVMIVQGEILVDIGRNRVYIDNTILHEKEYRILG